MPRRAVKVAKEAVEIDKPMSPKMALSKRINAVLSPIFYLIWIVIGLFFLLIIYGQIKSGAIQSIIGSTSSPQSANNAPATAGPTETDLPGIGKVNINCVQTALSAASIQKLVQNYDESVLTADEKTKFDACIVEKASPVPSGATSPAPSK